MRRRRAVMLCLLIAAVAGFLWHRAASSRHGATAPTNVDFVESSTQRLVVGIYPVEDLIARLNRFFSTSEGWKPSHTPQTVCEILKEAIDPDSHLAKRGLIGRVTPFDGRVLISATPAVHRRFAELIEMLRTTRPGSSSSSRLPHATELVVLGSIVPDCDFDGKPIDDVLKALAKAAGVDVVPDLAFHVGVDTDAAVTLSLRGGTLREAFTRAIEAAGGTATITFDTSTVGATTSAHPPFLFVYDVSDLTPPGANSEILWDIAKKYLNEIPVSHMLLVDGWIVRVETQASHADFDDLLRQVRQKGLPKERRFPGQGAVRPRW